MQIKSKVINDWLSILRPLYLLNMEKKNFYAINTRSEILQKNVNLTSFLK